MEGGGHAAADEENPSGSSSSSTSAARGWTCEACGCNTNTATDRTCTICGTSQAGPQGMRRHGVNYPGRAGWLARGLGARRAAAAAVAGAHHHHHEELALDDEDLWDSVVDGVDMSAGGGPGGGPGEDAESAIESLAMEVSGMARNRFVDGRQRFLDAARMFSQHANRAMPGVGGGGSGSSNRGMPGAGGGEGGHPSDPTELLRMATENAVHYSPRWATQASRGGGSARGGSSANGGGGIEVGEGERRRMAHLPIGCREGKAVRAEEPLPRAAGGGAVDAASSFGPFARPLPPSLDPDSNRPYRRAYGFRVAFDVSGVPVGSNMGGCYLVGVTSSSFTGYNDPNSLQQSPFFWGIEDNGQKYEGSRYGTGRGSRRANLAVELGATDVPMNSSGVLFGSREVITVVCDFDTRTLTFWRNDTLLGTLVTGLPRNGNLYPIAVPYNCGVAVAITGLSDDPLPLLRTFATDWRKVQREKDDQTRAKLAAEREMLIADGEPTPRLLEVLKDIFSMYQRGPCDGEILYADVTMASRLWYRCGMKLSCLDSLLRSKPPESADKVTLDDFVNIIKRVLQGYEEAAKSKVNADGSATVEQVGDKVELVDGYWNYGDASTGPLQPGDRATVVEIQEGPNGERRSVRVLHNGRRWWYQPQAVVSERSGLIESPGVWFLRGILRSHGYNHTTLDPMHGQPVTASSWRVGDLVMPKKSKEGEKQGDPKDLNASSVGRIVAETSGSQSSISAQGRDSGTVLVEFISREFAEAVGVKAGVSPDASLVVETRRVRTSRLLHATMLHGSPYKLNDKNANEKQDDPMEEDGVDDEKSNQASTISVSETLKAEIAGVTRLEKTAIDAITKECKKSLALAGLFSGGLPDAVLAAIDIAERQLNSPETREDLFEKITSIGGLAVAIADQLYSTSTATQTSNDMDESPTADSSSEAGNSPSRRSLSRATRPSNVSRLQQVQEAIARGDARREEEQSGDAQGMVSSLQQRRTMLLSLMSRAGRRNNASALNEALERGNLPPLGGGRGAPPLFFGSDSVQDAGWEEPAAMALSSSRQRSASQEDTNNDSTEVDSGAAAAPVSSPSSILRGDSFQKQGAVGSFPFVRHLIANGILVNSLDWCRALMDSQSKKVQLSSVQKSSSIIKSATDEEGTPLLQLAVALGCSVEMINYLISSGAVVGPEAIKKAAETNQPEALSLLLRHTSYSAGMVEWSQCSSDVLKVLEEAKNRQEELDRRMRDAAGSFMVRLLRKLLYLALTARQNLSTGQDNSRAIAEILIGNVLLGALQRAQSSARTPSRTEEDEAEQESAERSGRFPVEDTCADPGLSPRGLFGLLPQSVLSEALFADTKYMTRYLLVIEDYLCSKDLGDTASGLTFLVMLLSRFPLLRSSTEMERFGMNDLVSYHDELASNRVAEILARKVATKLELSGGSSGAGEIARLDSATFFSNYNESGVVLCPKQHTAVLHITRHSSFRCDLCGSGVDRGRPMHGCRECDWDACESCTDKAESGFVKCNTIRELASECSRMLREEATESAANKSIDYGTILEDLAENDNTTELNALAVRLVRRDIAAAKELGNLIKQSGRVSIHQFLTIVLPALHAALVGRSAGNDGALGVVPHHRSKKARVVGDLEDSVMELPDVQLAFFREAVRLMVTDEDEGTNIGGTPMKLAFRSQPASESDDANTSGIHKEDSEPEKSRKNLEFAAGTSELLRRLHQVLSLYEGVAVYSNSTKKIDAGGSKGGDLHALTKPIEIHLVPSTFSASDQVPSQRRLVVHAEPLIPLTDLQLHVLRTFKPLDPLYLAYCERLVAEKAIVVEKSASGTESWRLAQVEGFDPRTGAHTLRCASRWKRGQDRRILRLGDANTKDLHYIRFDGERVQLILAARKYFVLDRTRGNTQENDGDVASRAVGASLSELSDGLLQAIGTRIESSCEGNGSWSIFTLIGIDTSSTDDDGDGEETETRYALVSDDGVVRSGVEGSQIRALSSASEEPVRSRRGRDDRGGLSRPFPFFARQRSDSSSRSEGGSSNAQEARALKRSWSALSVVESMRPIELLIQEDCKAPRSGDRTSGNGFSWTCRMQDCELFLSSDATVVEVPPRLIVRFSTHEKLPGVDLSSDEDRTLVSALKELHRRQDKWREWPLSSTCQLFFSVSTLHLTPVVADKPFLPATSPSDDCLQLSSDDDVLDNEGSSAWCTRPGRARKLSARSLGSEDDDTGSSLCDGLNETCIQCMEVISLLSECAEDSSMSRDHEENDPGFANPRLSKKLLEQLDDPVSVVGGAIPDWCIRAPSYAPRVFSYKSRRMLLDRVAFGVSRSALKQQEAKVNVGKLRQRMASLRARAVELVGEAFSGGAEDPTALQLQADELYGMEEALAARVRAAFRAVKWQEHSLQVAKACVRRERLLVDATAVMDRYSCDPSVCRRRLEVRFEGESGFDAASGDEAGVTRGFYADVAEALVSCENVASVYCNSTCSYLPVAASLKQKQNVEVDDLKEAAKLPLWIPDMDSSGQVIIPSPRADPRSGLGLFPRPLPSYHPQLPEVLQRFRFIGRLFAASMRDGFMFPLPLSSAFLKLVQHGSLPSGETLPTRPREANLLSSKDLPRPGFLGGEVYAAEHHICTALNRLDESDPPLSRAELQRKYKEIATDNNFARVAFGRSYDCCFEDYFQDRTFVDPLDPAQGEEAVRLCPDGHKKNVTICNVREWVALAKNYILSGGVTAQALAFRSGVEDFFCADYLSLFTPEELQRDVCGVGDNVENWDESAVRKLFKLDGGKGAAEALVAVAAIGGEGGAALSRRFGPSSPTIGFLVKTLLEASPKQRRQFLSFVTSVPIVTPGKIEVVPMVSPNGEFLPMRDPGCLPRANTCSRRLYLPKFEEYDSFAQVLWAVVREESKFKGFFEWRGS